MVKYKLTIKVSNNPPDAVINSNLSNLNGYITHDNSIVEKNLLVNEENVNEYLQDPRNGTIVERFKKYLREYTNEIEFKEIYYKPRKVAPILNDYYNEEVRFDSEANPVLIADALRGTRPVYYTDNNFEFSDGQRMSNVNKSQLVEDKSLTGGTGPNSATTDTDYYIDVGINVREDSLFGTDFSEYFKNTEEDGVVYVNSFVDLNQKTNPFEFWTNDKPTKTWKTATVDTDEERVQGFENTALDFEKKANNIKDKNSIEYTVQANRAEKARKIADKKRAKLERKKRRK